MRDRGRLIQLRPDVAVDDVGDQGLVAACGAGDRAARALLFERHCDVVVRFVARLRGSDASCVEDLVQTTFLAAFQGAARFRGGNVRAWLFAIAANQVRSYARGEIRRKRAMSAVAETADRVRPPGDPSVIALPDAIASLPHDLRVALVLIDLEGERGVDAAAALGIPEGTLWRRVFEARRALREVLS
jgi:RNA polymerase sigma factor (sigma-70 family)